MNRAERACAAHAWQRALGHETIAGPLCRIVRDPAHPDVWDANHVSLVRAESPTEIARVLARAEEAFTHCRHRLFVVDASTPPSFVARLAMDDYQELTPTIQLVLEGPVKAAPRHLDLRPVASDDDWGRLHALLRRDHAEGARSQAGPLSEAVTLGMLASYRRKWPAHQLFLAREDGFDCAYGAGVLCEGGIGMVEDLFTLPEFRRRGIATAIIARAVAHVRERGAGEVLIGAHATEPPKRLYASLGFEPVCVTREYIARLEPRGDGRDTTTACT